MGTVGGKCVCWQTQGGYGNALGLHDTLNRPDTPLEVPQCPPPTPHTTTPHTWTIVPLSQPGHERGPLASESLLP